MLSECCNSLNICPQNIYLDCTLGGGGHTLEILRRGGHVIAIDQDIDSINKIRQDPLFVNYLQQNQLEIHHSNFSNLQNIIQSSSLCQRLGYQAVHGVLFDLGISSHQIDNPERGFTYRNDNSPLDMRMYQDQLQFEHSMTHSSPNGAPTAADLINQLSIDELANIFYLYGNERRSRQIATEIVSTRPHYNSSTLRKAIESVTRPADQIKTLSRCYQALRIVINSEIENLYHALINLHNVVYPSGRLVVLSYHSLEDRIIKQFLQKQSNKNDRKDSTESEFLENDNSLRELEDQSHMLDQQLMNSSQYWVGVRKGVIKPTKEEIRNNNRARSAKLRVGERL